MTTVVVFSFTAPLARYKLQSTFKLIFIKATSLSLSPLCGRQKESVRRVLPGQLRRFLHGFSHPLPATQPPTLLACCQRPPPWVATCTRLTMMGGVNPTRLSERPAVGEKKHPVSSVRCEHWLLLLPTPSMMQSGTEPRPNAPHTSCMFTTHSYKQRRVKKSIHAVNNINQLFSHVN